MRRLPLSFVLALSVPLLSLGCSNAQPSRADRSGAIAQPIVNGVLDSGAHPAVVFVQAIMGQFSYSCSGTIFKTDVPNNVGYVITAAHCVLGEGTDPDPVPAEMSIVTGDDGNNQNPMTTHQVLAFAHQPGYQKSSSTVSASPDYDVAIIKFKGVTASTPTLPLTTPELDADLADGQEMQIVGFGESGPNFDDEKKRNEVTNLGMVNVYDAVDDLSLAAPVGPAGNVICSGDSGGPWLRTINGQQYVTAVTSISVSSVGSTCGSADTEGGVGARVSPYLDSLIANFVAGSPPEETCNECSTNSETTSCAAQATACSKIIDCYEKAKRCGCALLDDACYQQCLTNRPKGADEFAALQACFCQPSVCASTCTPSVCTGAGGAGGAGGSGGSGGAATGGSSAAGAGGEVAGGASGAGGAETAGAGGDAAGGESGASGASAGTSSTGGAATNAGGSGGSSTGAIGGASNGNGGASAGTTGTAGTTSSTGAGGVANKGGNAGAATTGGASGSATTGADSATSPAGSSGGCEIGAPTQTPGSVGLGFLVGLLGLSRIRRGKRADD